MVAGYRANSNSKNNGILIKHFISYHLFSSYTDKINAPLLVVLPHNKLELSPLFKKDGESGLFAKEKRLLFPVTPCFNWWAVTGSNRGPTD